MARDIDIGKLRTETVNVAIIEDSAIVDALIEVTDRLDDSVEELKKVRRGQELILGEEIDEVD